MGRDGLVLRTKQLGLKPCHDHRDMMVMVDQDMRSIQTRQALKQSWGVRLVEDGSELL